MKQKKWCILFLSLLFLNTTHIVFAADNVQSDVISEIVEGDPSEIPPKFGIDEIDSQNNGTSNTGTLKIDRAPNIKFGIVPIKKRLQEVKAINKNPYVQISDVRGTLSGWRLSAAVSEFSSGTGENRVTIDGAALTLSEKSLQNFESEGAGEPTVYDDVELNYSDTEIAAANKNEGQGIWGIKWDKIKLKIYPNTAQKDKSYTATIRWTLTDAPDEN